MLNVNVEDALDKILFDAHNIAIMSKNGIPVFYKLQDIFANEALAIQYLVQNNVLNMPQVCGQCY